MQHGLKRVRQRRDDALARSDWRALESLMAAYYRGQGWRVEHCGTGAPERSGARFDGGIDLKMWRDDQYALVQCKHWNARQVPHNEVHQLLGLMVNEGANAAILVSSGEFTAAARAAAARLGHVQLIDGEALRALIGPLPQPEAVLDAGTLQFDRPPARRTRVAQASRRASMLPWIGVAVIGLIVFAFIIRALLARTAASAGPTPTSIGQPVDGVANEAAFDAQAPATQPPQAAPGHAVMPDAANACVELIDAPSGTTINHCIRGATPRPPTAREIAESQHRADAAMKLIEADTPEIRR